MILCIIWMKKKKNTLTASLHRLSGLVLLTVFELSQRWDIIQSALFSQAFLFFIYVGDMSEEQQYSSSEQMCEGAVRRQSNSTLLDKTQHGGEGDNMPSSFLHYTCFHWIRYPLKICKFTVVSSSRSAAIKNSISVWRSWQWCQICHLHLFQLSGQSLKK